MKRITLKKSTQTRLQIRTGDVVRGGFTLTELLIVMAILVLLVSLIGPRLLGSKQKADINAVKTQIGMFQSALERYAVDMNKFPATEEGLAALVSQPSADGSESTSEDSESSDTSGGSGNWDGPYIKTEKLPTDPWGKAYSYEYPPTHNKINVPDIWSFGPDGQENTDDDIKSWSGDGSGESSDGSSRSNE
ncbi:MAG: type II secretion system major pseudopilin GspG [Planctomycetota bacterium]|nr:type II secretion system major pseudopilin GspG [Planctomycetota bacterium]